MSSLRYSAEPMTQQGPIYLSVVIGSIYCDFTLHMICGTAVRSLFPIIAHYMAASSSGPLLHFNAEGYVDPRPGHFAMRPEDFVAGPEFTRRGDAYICMRLCCEHATNATAAALRRHRRARLECQRADAAAAPRPRPLRAPPPIDLSRPDARAIAPVPQMDPDLTEKQRHRYRASKLRQVTTASHIITRTWHCSRGTRTCRRVEILMVHHIEILYQRFEQSQVAADID